MTAQSTGIGCMSQDFFQSCSLASCARRILCLSCLLEVSRKLGKQVHRGVQSVQRNFCQCFPVFEVGSISCLQLGDVAGVLTGGKDHAAVVLAEAHACKAASAAEADPIQSFFMLQVGAWVRWASRGLEQGEHTRVLVKLGM